MWERLRSRLSAKTLPRIWVIGDVMLDRYYMGSVARVSPEAPVPVLLLDRTEDKLGGAANVAQNILALGAQAALAGRVGADEPAASVRSLLARAGVLAAGLVEKRGAVTTVKQRALAGSQQLLRIDTERVEPFPDAEIDVLLDGLEADLPGPDLVLLSDYGKGVVSAELLQRLRRRLPKVPVFVDPKGRDYGKYRGCSLITPNELEAQLASGVTISEEVSLRQAALALRRVLPGTSILITRGARGMSLLGAEEAEDAPMLSAPAQARRVFDVTGAGDTALAALAVGWTTGLGWPEILQLANVAAGIKVGKVGAVPVALSELMAALAHEAHSIKFVERKDLPSLRHTATMSGQRLVFTNGCFDLLHIGHLRLLEQSRRMGDLLLVAINSDDSVRRLKGPTRPINGAAERAALLAGLECVDLVTVFEEDTPAEAILACRPDVLVKGGDYTEETIVGASDVRSWGGRVEVVPLVMGRSSSRLIERMAG